MKPKLIGGLSDLLQITVVDSSRLFGAAKVTTVSVSWQEPKHFHVFGLFPGRTEFHRELWQLSCQRKSAAMFMNLRFSRGYAESQAVPSMGRCCYSNTNSAEVLLEQQRETDAQ